MASMDATDLTRVKALMGEAGTGLDTQLTAWIKPVSDAVERFLNRVLLKAARVEVVERVLSFQRSIAVKAYPVDFAVPPVVKQATARDFAVATAMDVTSYYLDAEAGIFHFDVPLLGGPGTMQIGYTGGMGADLAGLETAFPTVVRAASLEVQFRFESRRSIGKANESMGGAAVSWAQEKEQLCAEARGLLIPLRRIRVA